jgi:uncharacterized membrane protein
MTHISLFTPLDLVALAWFVGAWALYSAVLVLTERRKRGLNSEMDRYREVWMLQMLGRDVRMVDSQIVSALQWEAKTVGLAVIFVYAFFKFAWSYRLYNYMAIMVGAAPPSAEKDTPEAKAHAKRIGRLCEVAGRHFNRGQRAFFFALGYLGWFISPWLLMAASVVVAGVMWRRQFGSDSRRALVAD